MAGRSKGGAKTGGRKKGTPNKIIPEIRVLARQYGSEVIEKLVSLMRGQDERLELLTEKILSVDENDEEMRGLLRQLLDILSGRNVQNELGAAKELLDRGWGKAAQPVTGEDGERLAIVAIRRVIVDERAEQRLIVDERVGVLGGTPPALLEQSVPARASDSQSAGSA